jgi:hypothetical protein
MVTYMGGCCQRCGYNGCLSALGFHHAANAGKRFSIAGSHNRSWASLRDELDGCVLLCLNCHAEAHENAVSLGVVRWNRAKADVARVPEDPRLCTCQSCGRRYVHEFRKGHTHRFCNSDACLRALCFHHRDPRSKRFKIARTATRSFTKMPTWLVI